MSKKEFIKSDFVFTYIMFLVGVLVIIFEMIF